MGRLVLYILYDIKSLGSFGGDSSSANSSYSAQHGKVTSIFIISPQSELGAFYFCPGVLSGYCCVCVRVVTVVRGKEVTVIECAIGGLPKCAKFIRSGHTFRR